VVPRLRRLERRGVRDRGSRRRPELARRPARALRRPLSGRTTRATPSSPRVRHPPEMSSKRRLPARAPPFLPADSGYEVDHATRPPRPTARQLRDRHRAAAQGRARGPAARRPAQAARRDPRRAGARRRRQPARDPARAEAEARRRAGRRHHGDARAAPRRPAARRAPARRARARRLRPPPDPEPPPPPPRPPPPPPPPPRPRPPARPRARAPSRG